MIRNPNETVEIIILAQGPEQRLGPRMVSRQYLPLPACGNIPILCRTVRQVWNTFQGIPMIATWDRQRGQADMRWSVGGAPPGSHDITVTPQYFDLISPGTSALRGLSRYLGLRRSVCDRTVVLLGDIVYSWACLHAIDQISRCQGVGFVGTSNLSEDTGNLWGAGWSRRHEPSALSDLNDTLLRHPALDDKHQPGQFRRWITAWTRGKMVDHIHHARRVGRYTDVDDYTRDITPDDIGKLPDISLSAQLDDIARGVAWDRTSFGPGLVHRTSVPQKEEVTMKKG